MDIRVRFLKHVTNAYGTIGKVIFDNANDNLKALDKDYDDLIRCAKALEIDYSNHRIIMWWTGQTPIDKLMKDSEVIRQGGKVVTLKEVLHKEKAFKELNDVLPVLTRLIKLLTMKDHPSK